MLANILAYTQPITRPNHLRSLVIRKQINPIGTLVSLVNYQRYVRYVCNIKHDHETYVSCILSINTFIKESPHNLIK